MNKRELLQIYNLLLKSGLTENEKLTFVTVLLHDVTGAADLLTNLRYYEEWVDRQ